MMRILATNHAKASKVSDNGIERLLPIIKYRMNLMSSADELLRSFGVKAPDGKTCAEYDVYQHQSEDSWKHVFQTAHVIRQTGQNYILPKPYVEEQGLPFHKPYDYLAIAHLRSHVGVEKVKRAGCKGRTDGYSRLGVSKGAFQEEPGVKCQTSLSYSSRLERPQAMSHPTNASLSLVSSILGNENTRGSRGYSFGGGSGSGSGSGPSKDS